MEFQELDLDALKKTSVTGVVAVLEVTIQVLLKFFRSIVVFVTFVAGESPGGGMLVFVGLCVGLGLGRVTPVARQF